MRLKIAEHPDRRLRCSATHGVGLISNQSLGDVANSELVAVEIVRTLCGSIGLVAAVPITTVLAAIAVAGATPAGNDIDEPQEDDADDELNSSRSSWGDFGPRDSDEI